jgi:type-F conjugative transfer system pilin assembly protein TrbC
MRWVVALLISLPLLAAANPFQKCISGDCLKELETDLFLFVSFSMSDEALLYFSKELERCDGTFVLRGIPDNSFQKLFQKLSHLEKMGVHAPFSIDPDLFEKHSSKAIPTLMLKGEKETDCITGNLSIRDSLERFSLSGDNKALAKQKLKRGKDV